MSHEDKIPCPRCPDLVWHYEMCEHDDPDTGPLCVGRCCPYWHDDLPGDLEAAA